MDGKQIEGILKNWLAKDKDDASEYYIDDRYNDFMYDVEYNLKKPTVMQASVVTVSHVDSQTGGEDVFPASGGEIYTVIKVDTDGHVQYFKRSGYYRSFEGSDWTTDWVEVFPTEKKVTVYE